tara:strand:+ start:515 stop:739 length:225 start_codon:yes stop_codon:yes gene_type:complete
MSKTTDSLVRIVSAGGGLIIDCKGKTTDSLVRIASASKQNGSKVIMTNLKGKTTDSLVRIGSAGQGNVILDLRD